ncbi:hypothetical protein AGIG_G16653 [Arapaima gigas]
MGLDCMRGGAATSPQSISPTKRSMKYAGSLDSNSSSTRAAQSTNTPHCQNCISYEGHMKRLSCGHTFCDSCMDHIVNEAFLDIEGLCNFPCPMCKSLRQLGFLETAEVRPATRSTPHHLFSFGMVQLEVIKEEEEEEEEEVVVTGD